MHIFNPEQDYSALYPISLIGDIIRMFAGFAHASGYLLITTNEDRFWKEAFIRNLFDLSYVL